MISRLLLTSRVPGWYWIVLFGISFLLHFPFFSLPPTAAHSWRQCNTMAVARNFYEEDMNILLPRVDHRGNSDGITGTQFPAYEWAVAAAYKLLGFHESLPRIINWLIFSCGVVFYYYLVRLLSDSAWVGALGAWALSWSPELFYHSINALPDILALSASIGGVYFFLRWYQANSGAAGSYWAALLLTTLAGLTKLQFLAIGAPIAVLVLRDWWQKRLNWRRQWLALLFFALVSVLVPLGWYTYAMYLIKKSGLADFGLELRPASSLATGLRILFDNLLSDIPEALVGFPGFVLLLMGLWALVRGAYTQRFWFAPVVAWACILLAYHFIELSQMDSHLYYMIPYLPVMGLVVALGAAWLRKQRYGILCVILLGLQPVAAAVRIIPSRWSRGPREIPSELYYANSRAELEKAVPDKALCLVGPDVSGCKYFYFLHKKGFSFGGLENLTEVQADGGTLLANAVRDGAQYLYTNDDTVLGNEQVKPYLGREIKRVGQFRVLMLQEPQPRMNAK